MTREQMWQIFKNTGSVEAYIAYATTAVLEIDNVGNDENKGNNTEDQRHTGER